MANFIYLLGHCYELPGGHGHYTHFLKAMTVVRPHALRCTWLLWIRFCSLAPKPPRHCTSRSSARAVWYPVVYLVSLLSWAPGSFRVCSRSVSLLLQRRDGGAEGVVRKSQRPQGKVANWNSSDIARDSSNFSYHKLVKMGLARLFYNTGQGTFSLKASLARWNFKT